ncbi:hypothetical protein LTR37_017242 [Vermiconidia calcicola]|uniref:Uncharacterized protein n=1 Tax=Vermiconidia calcicola TaxID=1690605 RepID=A0ACC3MM36_9PEZI|nr:hypothetical protein LTR37_017242 [Vermiconidia calcicola]
MSAAQNEFNELMRDKERRTAHPEDGNDSDDARSFLNLSDDEDNDTTPQASHIDPDEAQSRSSTSLARHTIPLTRYGANTGPKGVISDAQNFRDSHRNHRMSMRSNSTLPSQINGGDSIAVSEKHSESDEDDDFEEDDNFMRRWRKSRLREMQKGRPESNMHNRERAKRLWGGMATVDGNGYLDAVDRSPSDTVVVVYIYDDYSHVSASIEDCIRTLAQRHLNVRFIKLHFEDAEMEPAGVPAILAYRGGEKFADLVPVIQEIPDDAELSASTLENVLRR